MRISKRLATILATAALLGWSVAALEARTRKGDRLYTQGSQAEHLKDYDKALDLYEQALAEDPADTLYQMASRRVRFQSAQGHVDKAQKLRNDGKLEEAQAEFEKAYAIDPASPIAGQELQRTLEMIDRAKTEGLKPEERGLTPAAEARRETDERLASVMSVPELKPLSTASINLKMNNQPPRVMFETVGKLAGINVLFDPDYLTQTTGAKPTSLELTNATLEQALDYLAMITKSFWKPINANAVFITQDTPAKRQEYEEQVARVFYISNASSQAELAEIMNSVRTVIQATRMFQVNSQNALIVRGTADQVALAEMLIRNLDKPKAEVVVDVIVMEVDRTRSRDLGATPVSGSTNGISVPITFAPKGTTTTTGTTTTQATTVSLGRLARLSSGDFSVTLPGATLEALMTDIGTRVLQSPQVRAIDNMKASLKIGEKVPIASGGFQPTFGTVGTGANSLYNQFTFQDVGVNVDITPKVHGSDEVTLHIELDISNVKERIDIGGISQPVIVQRKVTHDIRLREGEVSLLGGLVQEQQTKTISGVPGLSSIPLIRRLFSSETVNKTESELLIALVPHIVRTLDLDDLSYKGIASGNERSVRLSYAPARAAEPEPAAPKPQGAPAAPPAPQAAAAPGVMFSPAAVEAQPGGTFTLNLQAANVTDLFAAPLRIKFDQNVLRLTEVTRGGLLAGDGREVLFTRNILNDTGEASVSLSRTPGSAGISGSGTLVTLTFQVIGQGITTVFVPQLALQNSHAQTILAASPQARITIK